MAFSYFDLDDWQADEQQIRVRLLIDLPGSIVDQCSSGTEWYQAGTTATMPLWLARHLTRRQCVTPVPNQRAYGHAVREEVRAGVSGLALGDLASHYYLSGMKVAQLYMMFIFILCA